MQGHVDTTNCTTYQSQVQTWIFNIEIAKALYTQYEQAYGEAVDAQCEDFDTSELFGRAYGIGAALNAHLERAFGLNRENCESFWDMIKTGFQIGEAIAHLQADHDYRDYRDTIACVRFAMEGR